MHRLASIAILCLLTLAPALAQSAPAGRVIHVDCALHAGTPDGSREHPFPSIQAAADLAQPGDTVTIHAGVYREWVRPANSGQVDAPIAYQSAPGEIVTIKGSDVWTPKGGWQADPQHPDMYTGATR